MATPLPEIDGVRIELERDASARLTLVFSTCTHCGAPVHRRPLEISDTLLEDSRFARERVAIEIERHIRNNPCPCRS